MKKLSLTQGTQLYRLLGDSSRLRLLALVEANPLSVAELTEITGLAQSRVSTHLARLKRAGLVADQRIGAASLYSAAEDGRAEALWQALRARLDDPLLRLDREHAAQVMLARKHGQTWAESVAGRMELHYSPGRSWETTARALSGLLNLGDVLDIACGDGVFTEIIAEHAQSVVCTDISATVLTAARRRLADLTNVHFARADMQRLPFAPRSFDLVFAMHALPYALEPERVIAEGARMLRPGGRLVVATLAEHGHQAACQIYDHVNMGFTPATLTEWIERCGLNVESCAISSRETRPPYFEVMTAFAKA